MSAKTLQRQVKAAIEACQSKKGEDLAVLHMEKGSGAFTDYFVICSGANPRQIQAISDEIEEKLSQGGTEPLHIEGYQQAEWVLLDYVDFVVHVFSEKARRFYDLERLWKSARRLDPDLKPVAGERPGKRPRTAAGRRGQAGGPRSRKRRA